MKFSLTIFFLVSQLVLSAQNEVSLSVDASTLHEVYSKEEVTRKTFRLMDLDYDFFVNPGEDFNTTDIYSPKLPGCRLIVFLRNDTFMILLYECGSFYGAMTHCVIGRIYKNQVEEYSLVHPVKTKEELFARLNAGPLRLTRNKK